MEVVKVVLKRELVDGAANVGAIELVNPVLAQWHKEVLPVLGTEYSRHWLKELKNDRSSLAGAISDCYLARVLKMLEKQGVLNPNNPSGEAVGDLFLTLELDYKLATVAEMDEALKGYREANDEQELLSAYMAEVVVRRMGRWVEGQDIEVTGCRFALVSESGKPVADEQQKAMREYLACFGYPKSATKLNEVCQFIQRLRQDVPEIDDVVEEVKEYSIEDVDYGLMSRHAWLLFANRDRILADERLAQTQVNIRSGAAPASFPLPSIAAYLQFWQTDKGMIERDGRSGLIYRVAGMGGSGTNSCSVAWQNGTSGTISVSPFIDTWSPFVDLIWQFPPRENGMTLEKLVEILNHLNQNK